MSQYSKYAQSNLAYASRDFEYGGRDNPESHRDYVGNPIISLGILPCSPDIHVSDIQTYRGCRRRHLLQTVFGLRLKNASKFGAKYIGAVYHELSRELYTSGDWGRAAQFVDAALEGFLLNLDQEKDALGLHTSGASMSRLTAAAIAETDKAKVMAEYAWNYARWPDPPDSLSNWNVIGVEQPVRAYWHAVKDYTRSTLDLVMQHKQTGDIWIVDHKTHNGSPTRKASQFQFALQPRVYTVVAAEAYKDKGEVKGFSHNVIRTIGIVHKRNQTWEDYLAEAVEWYEGVGRHEEKRTDRLSDPSFKRSWMTFPTTPDPELLYTLSEYRQALRARPHIEKYDRNEDACFEYNSVCPFWDLCVSSPLTWGQVLTTLFTQEAHREDKDKNVIEVEIK